MANNYRDPAHCKPRCLRSQTKIDAVFCRIHLNFKLKGTVKENERGYRLKANHFGS